jgi:hypothetical protein
MIQIRTFDPKTCGALSDRSKSMFNLNEFPTWGKDSKRITIMYISGTNPRKEKQEGDLYAPPSALAIDLGRFGWKEEGITRMALARRASRAYLLMFTMSYYGI